MKKLMSVLGTDNQLLLSGKTISTEQELVQRIAGLLTAHYCLVQLYKTGKYNRDPSCIQCNEGTKTAQYGLCKCDALDLRRQAIYGQMLCWNGWEKM